MTQKQVMKKSSVGQGGEGSVFGQSGQPVLKKRQNTIKENVVKGATEIVAKHTYRFGKDAH